MQKLLKSPTNPPSNGSIDEETILFPEQILFCSISRANAKIFHATAIMRDEMEISYMGAGLRRIDAIESLRRVRAITARTQYWKQPRNTLWWSKSKWVYES